MGLLFTGVVHQEKYLCPAFSRWAPFGAFDYLETHESTFHIAYPYCNVPYSYLAQLRLIPNASDITSPHYPIIVIP
jgi:hypothetical protein